MIAAGENLHTREKQTHSPTIESEVWNSESFLDEISPSTIREQRKSGPRFILKCS